MVGHMATLLAPFEMSQARPCLRGSLPWSPHRTPCGDYFEGACLATCLENLSLFPPLSGHCSLTEHENPCPQQRRRLRCHRHSCFSCCLPSALSLPLQPPPLPGALRCFLPLPRILLGCRHCSCNEEECDGANECSRCLTHPLRLLSLPGYWLPPPPSPVILAPPPPLPPLLLP